MMSIPGTVRKIWTEEETQLLLKLYSDTPMYQLVDLFGLTNSQIYAKAQQLGLRRSPQFLASPFSGRLRPGAKIGGNTLFQKGQIPWNKGMKGLQIGGKETQFKKGHLQGKAALLVKPLGFERVTKDGIRQRKICLDGPLHRRWKSVHSILWEEHHGPIPKGHVVVFKNGNCKDIELNNLELVTRRELMLRNTIHQYPPELKEVIRTKSSLTRRINKLRKSA